MSVQIEKSAFIILCCIFIIAFLQNKTIIAEGDKTANAVSQKHLFERGQKGIFGLYSGLKNLNEKVAEKGDNSDLISYMAHFLDFAQTHFSTKTDNSSGEPRRASTAQPNKTDF